MCSFACHISLSFLVLGMIMTPSSPSPILLFPFLQPNVIANTTPQVSRAKNACLVSMATPLRVYLTPASLAHVPLGTPVWKIRLKKRSSVFLALRVTQVTAAACSLLSLLLFLFLFLLFSGPRCDRCLDGFFGRLPSQPCRPCECNDNIDANAVGNCDQ